MSKLYISYNQIHEALRQAVDKHNINDDFQPDLMVAIGGGGFIPARILRTFLHKRNNRNIPIQAIGLSLYEEIEIAQANNDDTPPQVTKTQWLNFAASHSEISLLGRRILIVDEVDDTRQTLAFAVEELLKDIESEEIRMGMKPGESNTKLGVFVLHNKDKPKRRQLPEHIMKNYFAAVEMPDQWLVYPWDAVDIADHTDKSAQQ
ncbi:hypoxanthine-guanine phosphoribosyltransferase [Apophysomyces sp. BC1034]|nr:hypoxanthine-guanine phosphoribosyltransferase [Apophysomyces sp. BC1015]KAG0164724.1 hypoxanthine-guanine phosphoribosyltransferase [Apophysomyces sp. BC1021]KAG0181179.1 hypoxanthine-guanine phosphoribosyltransferase [Apophysomyces sp. BC1034]